MPRKPKNTEFSEPTGVYRFEVKQGIQSRAPFWLDTMTVADIKQRFTLDRPDDISPMDIAQRLVDWKRVAKIKKFILKGMKLLPESKPDDFYVFPAVTVAIDSPEFEFELLPGAKSLGILTLPDTAIFSSCDGQHRKGSLLQAWLDAPVEMDKETIGVQYIPDPGGRKRRRIFRYLNEFAQKPNKSIITLVNEDDNLARIATHVMQAVPAFKGRTAYEATQPKASQGQLFSLYGLRTACNRLLADYEGDRMKLACTFWYEVSVNHPHWKQLKDEDVDLVELVNSTISFHTITLEALGMVGSDLLGDDNEFQSLRGLSAIDWSRDNPDWEQVFIHNGAIVKNAESTRELANYILSILR